MDSQFALCFDDTLAEALRSKGASVFIIGALRVSRPISLLRARRKLAEFLRREPFDVVVCHSSWPHMMFAPVVRAARQPLVYWRHDASDGRHWTDRWASQ